MRADQMQARARHEGGEPLHEFQGDITRWLVPSR